MIVVSDTSALTSLLQVNRADILESLYKTVLIPPAVHSELQIAHAALPHFIEVISVQNEREIVRLRAELHVGEAEAIALAKECAADLLLIDETVGRAVAVREGLPIIGLLGVLVQAKRSGVLNSVRELTEELERVAGFRVAAEIKELIFARARE
jgi:predicted nucleic acid-binding protein